MKTNLLKLNRLVSTVIILSLLLSSCVSKTPQDIPSSSIPESIEMEQLSRTNEEYIPPVYQHPEPVVADDGESLNISNFNTDPISSALQSIEEVRKRTDDLRQKIDEDSQKAQSFVNNAIKEAKQLQNSVVPLPDPIRTVNREASIVGGENLP